MIGCVFSCGLSGINGRVITIEVDVSPGIPSYDTVGLPDKAVSESRERVRAAIRNSRFVLPPRRVTVNLAPADLRKVGAIYDLPIALGLLAANGLIESEYFKDSMFVGELALDGDIRPVQGALSMALTAKGQGFARLFCPQQNVQEAACVEGLDIIGSDNLSQVVDVLEKRASLTVQQPAVWVSGSGDAAHDFALIRGQYMAKRAAEIAAAGGHNLLMMGPPGGGKTMLARAIPTILPDLCFEEAVEITRIHSAAGRLKGNYLVDRRPFCAPHHSASVVSMVGGGSLAKPGEISIAHLGMLFLDEMPEFDREVLEALRQPLEDGLMTIARAQATETYPARFMLLGAMNPCPCGYSGSRQQACTCAPNRVQQYRNKLSGPLMDRIDIFVTMEEISYDDFYSGQHAKGEDSQTIRTRVNACRARQQQRFSSRDGIFCNAHMTQRDIEVFCILESTAQKLYEQEFRTRKLNGRAHARTLRLARTIADLQASKDIGEDHLAEALQYRSLDGNWS